MIKQEMYRGIPVPSAAGTAGIWWKHGVNLALAYRQSEQGDGTDSGEDLVTVRLPRAHWQQIVDDIENMCGTSAEDIEILSSVEILEGTP